VFDSLKAAELPHSHGGKTEIIWDWESPKMPILWMPSSRERSRKRAAR
jgi:hypothetical protein